MRNLYKKDYKSIVQKLIPIFFKAGKKSIQLSGKQLRIQIKEDGTPVSNGDLEVDNILQEAIQKITPGIEIVSEETIKNIKKKKRFTFWLIDPIDGTSSYISGKDEYTINAALILNRKPVIGIIFAPKKNRLKRYIKNGGKKRMFYLLDKNQVPVKKKIKYCDYLIVNNKSKPILKKKVKGIISHV